MATLAESFLHDLEDLNDDSKDDEEYGLFDDNPPDSIDGDCSTDKLSEQGLLARVTLDGVKFDDDDTPGVVDAIVRFQKSKQEPVVSSLAGNTDFVATLSEVRNMTDEVPARTSGRAVISEYEYQLIERCNQLVGKLDVEILNIHSFIRAIYGKKLPELESIIFSPVEYIVVVRRIKNESDLTHIDFSDILPSTVAMAVTVAGSMTTGEPLPPADLEKVLEASNEGMHLADCRKDILQYLESRMEILAPNVSAIIGTALAARLVTHAGGIVSLARMPSQDLMLVGSRGGSTTVTASSQGGNVAGSSLFQGNMGSTAGSSGITTPSGTTLTRGIIYNSDIIQQCPLALRKRAVRLISGKVSLAARVDSFHESPSGEVGSALRDKVLLALTKAQEPPPAPIKKVLPVPDDKPKSRRGGRRHRKMKELYGMSELRKQANRLTFGPEAEEDVGQEGEGGFGNTVSTGTGYGKLRLQAKQLKLRTKKMPQKHPEKSAVMEKAMVLLCAPQQHGVP